MANPASMDSVSPQGRPLPLRTYSESPGFEPQQVDHMQSRPRSRHQSMTANLARLTMPADKHRDLEASGLRVSTSALTPPSTPGKTEDLEGGDVETLPELLEYDFSKLDYELDRAKLLGSGLWSDVYLAEPISPQAEEPSPTMLMTPPVTPQKIRTTARVNLYAVKLPTRPDAQAVFHQEAKILTHIHRHASSDSYIVPFHGLDPRNSALVFSALQSGSLQDLTNRMSQMTEVSRHKELVALFPTLAHDLTSGLDFLHNTAGVIHADIKPANILLSPSPSSSDPKKLQARYADFSASFQVSDPASKASTAAGGGTWTFLAPEQLRLAKADSEPSTASDIWSLGVTLLSLIILGSPYAAACGENVFRLREAVKAGDPLGFAAGEPLVRKRMQACQGFVDCCRLGLQKERGRRVGARGWRAWVCWEGWGG